jgi:hypothetical protein
LRRRTLVLGAVSEESDAKSAAREYAARQELAWDPLVHAELFLDRRRTGWLVKTKANGRGHSLEIIIDDRTRTILETRVPPRWRGVDSCAVDM